MHIKEKPDLQTNECVCLLEDRRHLCHGRSKELLGQLSLLNRVDAEDQTQVAKLGGSVFTCRASEIFNSLLT